MVLISNVSAGAGVFEDERQVWVYATQMLKGRTFMGTFSEKCYVDKLKSHLGVVAISEDHEELIRDVVKVKKRLNLFYGSDYWTGITTPGTVGAPEKFCIWGNLNREILGSFEYKIRDIHINEDKLVFSIKTYHHRSPRNNSSNDSGTSDATSSFSNTSKQFWQKPEFLTWSNCFETLKFTSILFGMIIIGLGHLLKHSANYLIKFMDATSRFVHAVTPIIIAGFDLIQKIIGGFYLLILSMWKSSGDPSPRNYLLESNRRQAIQYRKMR